MTDTSNGDNSPDAQDDAPPSSSWTPPRGAPSPLSSLAGAASDTGVWNRPDLKTPDQPTTVARQFPGIPDQPPPMQGQPPRQGPPKPPPIGLSPGHPFPFRPRPIQRYFPPLPNRQWSEWGQPRPFGPEPQPWEVPGIYGNVARYFTQNGSGFTAPTASMLGTSTQGHSKAYMEGQKYALGILEERMKINAEALDQKSYQEQKDYRDAFALGGGDVGTWSGDPKAKDATELHDRLMEVANKYNDKPMLAALESGNLQRAENILKERDANGTALRESVTQQRKDDEKRKEEAPWRTGGPPAAVTEPGDAAAPPADGETTPTPGEDTGAAPPATPGAAPPGPTPRPPGQAPGDEDQPPADEGGYTPKLDISQGQPGPQGVQVAQAGASDAPQPGMQRLAQAQTQPQQPDFTPAPSQALQDAANDKDRVTGEGWKTDLIDAEARKLVTGDIKPTAKGLPGVPPGAVPYVVTRQLEIEKDLDRIQADPRLTGQKALAAIRKVDPQLAEDVAGYTNGSLAPPRGATALKPPWNRVVALGSKVDPTFTGQTFTTRAGTLRDFTSGQDGRNLVSIATAYRHLHAVQDDLKKIPQGLLAQYFGKYKGIGPLVATKEEQAALNALDTDINTAAAEYERALTGGKPTVSGRDEQMGDLNYRALTPDAIQGNIQHKIDRLKERMENLKTYFSAGTGRQPGDMFKLFDTFSRSGRGRPGADELGPVNPASPDHADALRQLESERPAPPPAAPRSLDDYKPGFTRGGYRLKGGDPTDEKNWEQVQ